MNKDTVLGLIRHILTTLGGVAIANGYINASGLEAIAGGIVAALGVAWSIFEKRSR